jgi:ketosteroid isomerase-like protein
MPERTQRLREGFAALERGRLAEIETLFAERAQWLGVPGSGWEGATPI